MCVPSVLPSDPPAPAPDAFARLYYIVPRVRASLFFVRSTRAMGYDNEVSCAVDAAPRALTTKFSFPSIYAIFFVIIFAGRPPLRGRASPTLFFGLARPARPLAVARA